VFIGDRLRALREEKHLSRGDFEKQSGLRRCYICRVENGHSVPAVETLEKMARALGVPIYRLFYERDVPRKLPNLPKRRVVDEVVWDSFGKGARYMRKLRDLLGRMDEDDRRLILAVTQKMVRDKVNRPHAR
jgi:transcriptional regulator with XRE-family HTH domain